MADGTPNPAPGARLGRYELLEELGRGGMGVVFKARDPAIHRLVAIKTLRLDMLAAGEDRAAASARFAREARAIGQLSHPHIVTLYDAQQAGDLAYLVMEFIAGESLQSLLRKGTRFPLERVCAIGIQICDALAHAHSRGVVHRDIKPGNILWQQDGRAKVADFGVAHLAQSTLTRTGQSVGTPSYMSPEQIEGKPVDGRSDLFSLGAVLYELACNEKAFPGDTVSTVIYRILHTDPIPLSQLNTLYPPGLDAAIRKALAKNPAARYARAGEFGRTLSRLAGGMAAPGLRPARTPKPRSLLIGGVAGTCIFLAGLVVWYLRSAAPGPAVPEPPRAVPSPSARAAAEPPPPAHSDAHSESPATASPQEPAPARPRPPKAMRVTFARDVKGVLPVEEGETFYRDDRKVVLWVRWANVRGRHVKLARWFDPGGNPVSASAGPEGFDSPAEWWTTWTALDLSGVRRVVPGRWRVEILLDDQIVATAHFTLLDQPRPPAPAPPAADRR